MVKLVVPNFKDECRPLRQCQCRVSAFRLPSAPRVVSIARQSLELVFPAQFFPSAYNIQAPVARGVFSAHASLCFKSSSVDKSSKTSFDFG